MSWQTRWQPSELVVTDTLHVPSAQFLAATLDRSEHFAIGDVLPNAWHWCYFLSAAKRSALGYDGHVEKGDFLPPIALPRRMWGGSRFVFHAPLRLGETVQRRSNVVNVKETTGKSGKLAFVTVRHIYEICAEGTKTPQNPNIRFEEEHDIVYRDVDADRNPDKNIITSPAQTDADFSHSIVPDPTLLFRYSALTFNGHRIHYDLPFCRDQEGYRNLVVHGPLVATLLINFAADHCGGRPMTAFEFKAKSPLFCDAAFSIHGKHEGDAIALWAANAEGGLAMEARAAFA